MDWFDKDNYVKTIISHSYVTLNQTYEYNIPPNWKSYQTDFVPNYDNSTNYSGLGVILS